MVTTPESDVQIELTRLRDELVLALQALTDALNHVNQRAAKLQQAVISLDRRVTNLDWRLTQHIRDGDNA